MTDPIGLTELRSIPSGRLIPRPTIEALIDAVEAAHEEVTSGYHGGDYLVTLIDALARFDFGDNA